MSGISPIAHSMESATRYVRLDPPQHVTARMMQQFAAGEPVDGGTDMPKPTTPSQGLDAATVERCAQVCEEQQRAFLSPQYAAGQPLSSFAERFAAGKCAQEIRALINQEKAHD